MTQAPNAGLESIASRRDNKQIYTTHIKPRLFESQEDWEGAIGQVEIPADEEVGLLFSY